MYNEPSVKFILEFYFEPNDYFTNRILTKTYFLNCLPDPDDPFSYDGAEIYKCEGCKIDWKNPEKEKEKKCKFGILVKQKVHSNFMYFTAFTSFFDFFDPPTLPENPNDPTYSDINVSCVVLYIRNDFLANP